MRTALALAVAALAMTAHSACSDSPNGNGPFGTSDVGPNWDISKPGDATTDAADATDTEAQPEIDFDSDVIDCTPFEVVCAGPLAQAQCNGAGDGWIEAPCPNGKGCTGGECVEQVCTPNASTGECTGPTSHQRCNSSGTALEDVTCGPGTKCFKGNCIAQLCQPGVRICAGPAAWQECDSTGDAYLPSQTCPAGGLCDKGQCLSPCDVNIKAGSYLGCEYYAMDLDNIEESQFAPVGLVVSVPADKAATTVTIRKSTDNQVLTPGELGVSSTLVQPGQVQVFVLPSGFDVDGSEKTNKTFKLETSSPVAVHQFNPLNGEGVFTNDASLLLPSNVTGREYVVMSWPHRNDGTTLRGFATVIATQPGTTQVMVTPSAPIVAGFGIAAMTPGTQYLFVLNQGEALNFETDGEHGTDLTGTIIEADKKVSVIGGHECANVPLGISACDHMEQQLFPVETWSTEYVADSFKPRSSAQVDIYRVVAGDNDVTVTTTPAVPGYEQFKLQRGQWLQFTSGSSFLIEADGPVMVGHYLTGANYPGAVKDPACEFTEVGKPEPLGDPAFTLSAPVKRYLKEYAVLTPNGYMPSQNYVNIIVQDGTSVTIDGTPVTAPFVAIPGTGFSVAQQQVTPGVHTIVGSKAFGLTAYGYDCDVSYAYPGGLKLVSVDD